MTTCGSIVRPSVVHSFVFHGDFDWHSGLFELLDADNDHYITKGELKKFFKEAKHVDPRGHHDLDTASHFPMVRQLTHHPDLLALAGCSVFYQRGG